MVTQNQAPTHNQANSGPSHNSNLDVAQIVAKILSSNRNAIARQTGKNATHIGRIFKGTRTPSLNLAFKIAAYLDLTLDEFYAGIKEIKANPELTAA